MRIRTKSPAAAAAITPLSSHLSRAGRAVEEVAVLFVCCWCCGGGDGCVETDRFVETEAITFRFVGGDGAAAEAQAAAIAHGGCSVMALALLDRLGGGSGGISAMVRSIDGSFELMNLIHHVFSCCRRYIFTQIGT